MKNEDATLRVLSSTSLMVFLMREFFTAGIRKFLCADFMAFIASAVYSRSRQGGCRAATPADQDFLAFVALFCTFFRPLGLF